ncbi:MAG TPA: RluA family pseudouridine synthase [Clostridia bacterium]|nr:RluA family pseudouridine synthase [Clostridia bacterium]
MRSITIDKKYSEKRIDKAIRGYFPDMPQSALFKAFRKKDIKVNGIRVKEDQIVLAGDKVDIFIADEIIDGKPLEYEQRLNKGFTVVFEDSNLLIVNKEQGIPVHPDRDQKTNTLIDLVRSYLTMKGEYNPNDSSSFAPSLCHRLDRNTGGLIIIAKNNQALKDIIERLENNEIKKFYQCLVTGKMDKDSELLKAYLIKDENKSRVFISDQKTRESLDILTRYKVLDYKNDISRLEVELLTGRTHQIRAHLAYTGHPIIGDGKYGTNAVNRSLGAKYQALWSYKLEFAFRSQGFLSYLKGRRFEVEPGFKIKNLT